MHEIVHRSEGETRTSPHESRRTPAVTGREIVNLHEVEQRVQIEEELQKLAQVQEETPVVASQEALPPPIRFGQLWSRFMQKDTRTKIQTIEGVTRGIVLKKKFDVWDFPIIERGVKIEKRKGTRLEAGRAVRLRKNSIIVLGTDKEKTPLFRIEARSAIGENTKISVGDDITIGTNTHISWDCDISSDNFHPNIAADGSVSIRSAPIHIGDNTVIFRRVIINPGVTIGSDCQIGSGSVVVKDIPSNSMAAGNPATVKKRILGTKF